MATNASVTGVAASATTVQLVAYNGGRTRLFIANGGSTTMYIRFGTVAASIASGGYSISLAAGAIYEDPGTDSCWDGAVQAIWAGSPTGYANVTECG